MLPFLDINITFYSVLFAFVLDFSKLYLLLFLLFNLDAIIELFSSILGTKLNF